MGKSFLRRTSCRQAVLLVLGVALVSIAGCGGGDNAKNPGGGAGNSATEAKTPPQVKAKWPSREAVLAAAPSTALVDHEVKWREETYVISAPEGVKLETTTLDDIIKVHLSRTAVINVRVGLTDMEERKVISTRLFENVDSYVYADDDLLITNYRSERPDHFLAYMNVTTGPRDFSIWPENPVSESNQADLTLEECLLALKCGATLHPKEKYPEGALEGLKRLGCRFEPEEPKEAGEITEVRFVDFTTGSHLKYLEQLPKLQSVRLDPNYFEYGRELAPLKNCQGLKKLDISGYLRTDDLLKAACECRGLEELKISASQSKGPGLEGLKNLAGLKVLNLQIRQEALPSLAAAISPLQKLAHLELDIERDLEKELVAGNQLDFLVDLGQLRSLSLKAGIKDQDLAVVSKLSKLESLQLLKADLTDAALASLGKLSALKQLTIDGEVTYDRKCAITGKGLGSLPKSLTELRLKKCPIDDAGVGELAKLTGIATLELTDLPITDAVLKHLEGLPALATLELKANEKLTTAAVKDFEDSHPKVKVSVSSFAF